MDAAIKVSLGRYLSQRGRSFACAINGVWVLFSTQAHARIHLVATLVVVAMGAYFKVSRTDWALLLLAMAAVWVAEAINTAIELTVDLFSPSYHPLAGKAKDVAAGAVLIASIFAVVMGVLVFADNWGADVSS